MNYSERSRTMRLFLAIDLPAKVKTELEEQITPLKKEYPQFNWVSKENFHITIHFYGDTNKDTKIKEQLKNLLYDQESFYLYSREVDLFINAKIVIYLNFRREKKLEELEKKLGVSGKKFIPHLSLARCRIPSKQQYFVLKKRTQKLNIDISFPVKKVSLFESILGGKKPTYKKLAQIPLI